MRDGQLVIPVVVDGQAAHYSVSTDGKSLLSESEARRLGGATAQRLKIGNVELKNVTFQIVRADEAPSGGVIGLPVLAALKTVRWKADGTFEAGFPSQAKPPNMCFDDGALVTEDYRRVGMDGLMKALAVTLDFGSMRLTLE
jgi:hypothetical protein